MDEEKISDRRAWRRECRRQAILDVARRSFCERGFAETSMSQIAAECGGSKTTLWSYFPSKEALFLAYLDSNMGIFDEMLEEALEASHGLVEALGRFGRVFLKKILSPDASALRRLINAESQRFPGLARAFYERGPRRVRLRLTRYMAGQMAAGLVRTGDAELAARQFLALCQAGAFADIVWHRSEAPVADPATDADHAVDAFLRIWGPDTPD